MMDVDQFEIMLLSELGEYLEKNSISNAELEEYPQTCGNGYAMGIQRFLKVYHKRCPNHWFSTEIHYDPNRNTLNLTYGKFPLESPTLFEDVLTSLLNDP